MLWIFSGAETLHAARAFSPKEMEKVNSAAESFSLRAQVTRDWMSRQSYFVRVKYHCSLMLRVLVPLPLDLYRKLDPDTAGRDVELESYILRMQKAQQDENISHLLRFISQTLSPLSERQINFYQLISRAAQPALFRALHAQIHNNAREFGNWRHFSYYEIARSVVDWVERLEIDPQDLYPSLPHQPWDLLASFILDDLADIDNHKLHPDLIDPLTGEE